NHIVNIANNLVNLLNNLNFPLRPEMAGESCETLQENRTDFPLLMIVVAGRIFATTLAIQKARFTVRQQCPRVQLRNCWNRSWGSEPCWASSFAQSKYD